MEKMVSILEFEFLQNLPSRMNFNFGSIFESSVVSGLISISNVNNLLIEHNCNVKWQKKQRKKQYLGYETFHCDVSPYFFFLNKKQ